MSDEMSYQEIPDPSPEDLVPMTDGEFVLAVPEMEALGIQSLLAANGIDAILAGGAEMPNLMIEIHVPAASLEDATRVYQEARQAGAAAADAAEAEGEAQGDIAPTD